jgi:hypothetical protein
MPLRASPQDQQHFHLSENKEKILNLFGFSEELLNSSDERMAEKDKLDKALDELDNWYDNALKSGGGFKNDEERQAYLQSLGDPEKHPMFASNTEDLEGHPLVEALRAIKEENKTNIELAVMYKDEGNEWLKAHNSEEKKDKKKKNLYEAYERYTHAIQFIEKEIMERLQRKETENVDNSVKEAGSTDVVAPVMSSSTASSSSSSSSSTLSVPIIPYSLIYKSIHLLSSENQQLFSQIYSNRAAISLLLTNYGSCKSDCNLSLSIWKNNNKAYLRKAKSLFLLHQYLECFEFSTIALEIFHHQREQLEQSKEEKDVKQRMELLKQIEELSSYLQKSKEYLNQKLQKQKDLYSKTWNELQEKWLKCYFLANNILSISLGYFSSLNPEPLQLKDVWPHYSGEKSYFQKLIQSSNNKNTSVNEEELSQIEWPILCLYPQYNQLDILPDCNINSMIVEYLAMMFPEPEEEQGGNSSGIPSVSSVSWDLHREYHISNLVIYISIPIVMNGYKMTSSLEWLISCLEYYSLIVNNGSVELMKYALNDLLQNNDFQEGIKEIQQQVKCEKSKETKKQPSTMNRCILSSDYGKYFDPSAIEGLTNEIVQNIVRKTEENINSYHAAEGRASSSQSEFYYEIHFGCKIYKILQKISSHLGITPRGILSLIVFPRNSKAHRIFLQKNQKEGISIIPLEP